MRLTAIRVSESLQMKGDASFQSEIGALTKDKDPNVVLQALGTARLVQAGPDAEALITSRPRLLPILPSV